MWIVTALESPGLFAPARRSVVRCGVLALFSALILSACRGLPALPPTDLSAPGWRVQQGQAVWKPTKERPELTGELLLATNANGDFFVQFAKPPFTLATAQVAGDHWQIEFGSGKFSRRGGGQPPTRFAWFQLPPALAGTNAGRDWRFERVVTNSWRMENRRTGEVLEGAFFP
jgi:hypothetical protein